MTKNTKFPVKLSGSPHFRDRGRGAGCKSSKESEISSKDEVFNIAFRSSSAEYREGDSYGFIFIVTLYLVLEMPQRLRGVGSRRALNKCSALDL
jgi:hypothetical protein